MGGDIQALYDQMQAYIAEHERPRFQQIALRGSNFSVRTRQLNQLILLIVKASIDDTTSANGISRLEFEAETPSLTLDELDACVLAAGYTYQAKWSRQREQYQLDDVTVCLDKNAGYGYLAEFEIVVQDAAHVDTAKAKITTLMAKLHAAELPQDRLERMFAHYNLHWCDYYGTDKVFTVL
jgi:adenylate cyclase class IV